ncbi:MAG: RNA helicase [Crocinitomicaceae bacterium]|nr:RNA helicase [Crocinitomicaceae bacterium]|tara:strand:- start:2180 stop:3418 length:1239 start_codon:yes stop_codon:yes gene_type:complete
MKFDSYTISSEIKINLEQLGFKRPTDIQFKAIPNILNGEDVLAVAQTGTGKTAAFAIPIIHKVQENKRFKKDLGIQALVMVPTRELALQITKVFHELARNTKVRTISIYGGVEQETQQESLERGIDILVATPGRMFDFLNQKSIDLRNLKTLILDEADQMLALGFYKDIKDVLHNIPVDRQTLFFSATINEEIKKLAYSLVTNPIRIQLSPKDPVSKNVSHALAFIEMDDKRFFLERYIKDFEALKILVFVRTKVRAERVKAAMERVNLSIECMHGDVEQNERIEILNRFKNNDTKVLITTDVNARGIDIPNVDLVINYDMPDVAENYVHRIGRTGRGRAKGTAVSFCAKEERDYLEAIENYTGVKITRIEIDKGEKEATILFSDDGKDDWKSLIDQNETFEKKRKKKKKKS